MKKTVLLPVLKKICKWVISAIIAIEDTSRYECYGCHVFEEEKKKKEQK